MPKPKPELVFSKEFLKQINDYRTQKMHEEPAPASLEDEDGELVINPLRSIEFDTIKSTSSDKRSIDQTNVDFKRTSSLVFKNKDKELFSFNIHEKKGVGKPTFDDFIKFIKNDELFSEKIQSVVLRGYNQGGFLSTGTALFNIFNYELSEKLGGQIPTLETKRQKQGLADISNSFEVIDAHELIFTQKESIQTLILNGKKTSCEFTIETKTRIQHQGDQDFKIELEEFKITFKNKKAKNAFERFYGLENSKTGPELAPLSKKVLMFILSMINFIIRRIFPSRSTFHSNPLALSHGINPNPLALSNAIKAPYSHFIVQHNQEVLVTHPLSIEKKSPFLIPNSLSTRRPQKLSPLQQLSSTKKNSL